MTAPKPKLETTTTPQDSEPTPSEVVDVHNLTLEAALKIVRELIDREESKGSIASQPMRCHFDRSEPTPFVRVRFLLALSFEGRTCRLAR